MSKEIKPRKPRSSTKKSTSELEAKIAELEAKLGKLSSQVKPAEQHARPAPPPAPKPKEVPAPSTSSVSSGEVAPAYATTSSTGYTGNKYYATRARLSYHPPDKQYKGEPTTQTSTSRPSPEPQYTYQETSSQQKSKSSSTWKAKGAQAAEEYTPQTQPARHEETRPAPPPAPKPRPAASGPTHGTLPAGMTPPPKPTVAETAKQVSSTEERAVGEVAPAYATTSSTGYTGNKYYATRARLSYHPPDKQYKGGSATAQTVQVAPEPPKPKRGTLPAGWKP
jgi:hypothetical protein